MKGQAASSSSSSSSVPSDCDLCSSYLLLSGFWSWSRHMNYLGDLLLSAAFCAACIDFSDSLKHLPVKHLSRGGYYDFIECLLPLFYFIYMTILLLHRINRDETKCAAKYKINNVWNKYKNIVKYNLIPYIY